MKLALPAGAVKDGGAPGYDGSAAYLVAAGLSAAKLGDLATANVALDKLKAMRTQAETGSNAYRAKPFAIMEKEVGAAVASAQLVVLFVIAVVLHGAAMAALGLRGAPRP